MYRYRRSAVPRIRGREQVGIKALPLLRGTLDVLILKTLSWRPMHGYAVSRWIRDHSGNELLVEEGALYPALRRLERRGLLEGEWRRSKTGRDTRVYQLTEAGQEKLQGEIDTWSRYADAMGRVLFGEQPAGS